MSTVIRPDTRPYVYPNVSLLMAFHSKPLGDSVTIGLAFSSTQDVIYREDKEHQCRLENCPSKVSYLTTSVSSPSMVNSSVYSIVPALDVKRYLCIGSQVSEDAIVRCCARIHTHIERFSHTSKPWSLRHFVVSRLSRDVNIYSYGSDFNAFVIQCDHQSNLG